MSSGLLLVIIELPVVPGGSTLLLIWQRITLIQMAGDGMSGILEYSDLCGCTRHEKQGALNWNSVGFWLVTER